MAQSAEATTSTVTMAAGRADIMAVIADFESYPDWAGAVREAEVQQAGDDGRASRVRFVLDAGVLKDEYVLGYTWDDDKAVSWELVEQGTVLSGMSGAYRLTEHGDHTEVTYELTVKVKIPMIGVFKRKAEKVIIDTALKELKRRVEE